MELNEALRRTVGGHWRLLVLFLVLPMLVVATLELGDARTYVSKARVQASATLPTTDVQANAMLSRVRAVATSGSVLKEALKRSGVDDRSQAQVAAETHVARLGGSAVFHVKVTDPDPRTAEKLAGAVSEELVAFFNGSGNLLITQLTDRQQQLRQQRLRVAAEIPNAADPAESGRLTAQLGALDQQILDIQASLRAAEAAGLGDRTASLLSSASDAEQVQRVSPVRVILAGAAGLVAGLLLVMLLEILRPHVGGQSAFARELGGPVLGRLGRTDRRADPGAPPPVDAETVTTLRRAVARRGLQTLVVTGPAPDARLAALARELEARLAAAQGTSSRGTRPGARQAPAPGPAESDGGPVHAATGSGGLATAVRERTEPVNGRITRVAPASRTTSPRVRALHETDDVPDGARTGLVAVEPDLPPYAELRRVHNLLAATGWPLVGVLGDPDRHQRARSR
ncbi:hypothetical protein [Streptomyces sp. NPDC053367]|uniref:hypothetical protein n=1 Tax=Streptomyces sp. NPDC053367 TaxID=3365700 RepID=UPI0037D59580